MLRRPEHWVNEQDNEVRAMATIINNLTSFFCMVFSYLFISSSASIAHLNPNK
jgi:hypothetical protein